MTVFLRVYDAVSDHRVILLDPRDGTYWCTCGYLFGCGGPGVTCPYELIWSKPWPGAGDRWWER